MLLPNYSLLQVLFRSNYVGGNGEIVANCRSPESDESFFFRQPLPPWASFSGNTAVSSQFSLNICHREPVFLKHLSSRASFPETSVVTSQFSWNMSSRASFSETPATASQFSGNLCHREPVFRKPLPPRVRFSGNSAVMSKFFGNCHEPVFRKPLPSRVSFSGNLCHHYQSAITLPTFCKDMV